MSIYKYQLRKGSKKEICAGCSQKTFVPYVDTQTGQPLAWDVGKCDRENKCRWDKKPKEYFADNPNSFKFGQVRTKKRKLEQVGTQKKENQNATQTNGFDFIAPEHLKATLYNYDRNTFVQFLLNLFPDCSEEIQTVLRMYFVGTYEDYTCFPSIDRLNRICRAKLIRFNPGNGKRLKGDYDTSSLKTKLKLKEDFNYKQIFFGEHLLPKYPNKPIAIVEAEKSAIVGSLCFPEFTWLGSGSKQWLKTERIERLENRQIILYPDADGFDLWSGIAAAAKKQGLTVKASRLIEDYATTEQKADGYDLADYLINQQKEINETNDFIDSYNIKIENILSDETLRCQLDEVYREQIAVMMIDGELSERDAEAITNLPKNIRRMVLNL